MFLPIRKTWQRWGQFVFVCGLSTLVIAISEVGLLQPLEWFVVDQFFRMRTSQSIDPRILIITIDESDLNYVGTWPIPDDFLADFLTKVNSYNPRGIGLDIYRNLPVGNGHDDLAKVFNNTPILVGVEKVVGEYIGPPLSADPERQVGLSDLVVDDDGRVRRGLLAIQTESGKRKYGLAMQLALMYLEEEHIYPEVVDNHLILGKATFRQFQKNDGGYANADAGGSQILIDFPSNPNFFDTVSMTAVLKGDISDDKIRNRIVLIGPVATSLNDFFYTPVSRTIEMPGIFVHAHILSQLLGSALDGRRVLHGVHQWVGMLWIFLLTCIAGQILHLIDQHKQTYRRRYFLVIGWFVPGLWVGVFVIAYGLFNFGFWVPVVAPILSISCLSIFSTLRQNKQLAGLATYDELTQIPNRRTFDGFLQSTLHQQKSLALVLCDVDYFKRYNDAYGHLAGDACLKAVAQTLKKGVRHSDLAARYGGEEFALVLPDTSVEMASHIIERIQQQLAVLEILHEGSDVNPYVTLSFGIAFIDVAESRTPKEIIAEADSALYQAKRLGRNRFFYQS